MRTSSHCPVLLWGKGVLESTAEEYLALPRMTNILGYFGSRGRHLITLVQKQE